MIDTSNVYGETTPEAAAAPNDLPDHLKDLWPDVAAQCKRHTPPSAIEAICRQVYLMRDAADRIHQEGAVVVDGKGNPAEHPAIKIQREAGKELREWLVRYSSR